MAGLGLGPEIGIGERGDEGAVAGAFAGEPMANPLALHKASIAAS